MKKFKVQSGLFNLTTHATDANGAALWLINQMVETVVPDRMRTSFNSDPFDFGEAGLLLLDEKICVTDVSGDDGQADEHEEFDTIDLFTEWNELALAVARMEAALMRQHGATDQPVTVSN